MDTASRQSRVRRLVEWTPPRWALLGLLLVALIVRGRFVLSHVDSLRQDPDGYGAVARTLAEGGVFAHSPLFPVPTAQRPPLYPIALVAVTYLPPGQQAYGVGFLHVLLGVGTVWAVWRLGRQWNLPPGTSLLGAALVAADPLLLAQSTLVMTETMATFLAAIALVAVSRYASGGSIAWAAASGLLLALCVLCRPVFLPWLVLVGVTLTLRDVGPGRVARLAAFAGGAALVLAPWAGRNLMQLGSPVITTTHGGFTLLLANNPQFYEYLRNGAWGEVWDGEPIYAAQPRRGQDELAVDSANYAQALENIRAEPGMFAWSCLVRLGRLWNVLPHRLSVDESSRRRGLRYAVAIFYTFEFALAATGVWFLRGKLFAHPWLWGTLLVLSITAVHAFYWTNMRMRAPLVPVVALAAAHGATLLACGRSDASATESAS
ncbi:MAG: phospholipid carrier-dependent glycosyltransferase [Planctomycetota bacterium]|nr:MAG: phospholipid carrier-dependent glycosyltransferase [Planctomycetota bacterium]